MGDKYRFIALFFSIIFMMSQMINVVHLHSSDQDAVTNLRFPVMSRSSDAVNSFNGIYSDDVEKEYQSCIIFQYFIHHYDSDILQYIVIFLLSAILVIGSLYLFFAIQWTRFKLPQFYHRRGPPSNILSY